MSGETNKKPCYSEEKYHNKLNKHYKYYGE